MKKLVFIGLLCFSSILFAQVDIGVRIHGNTGNGVVDIGFRSDDHRYHNRYKKFNYRRHGYFDNYGYYFGYFDRTGYFFNNIFFTYNNRYSYYDRLHRRGFFKPNRPHFRKYKYTRGNNWNKKHKYRRPNERIYGHYYDRKPKSYKNRGQIIKKNRQMEYKKRNFDNRKYDHRKNYKKNRYEAKKNRFEAKKNRFNSNRNKKREYAPEYRKSR